MCRIQSNSASFDTIYHEYDTVDNSIVGVGVGRGVTTKKQSMSKAINCVEHEYTPQCKKTYTRPCKPNANLWYSNATSNYLL